MMFKRLVQNEFFYQSEEITHPINDEIMDILISFLGVYTPNKLKNI